MKLNETVFGFWILTGALLLPVSAMASGSPGEPRAGAADLLAIWFAAGLSFTALLILIRAFLPRACQRLDDVRHGAGRKALFVGIPNTVLFFALAALLARHPKLRVLSALLLLVWGALTLFGCIAEVARLGRRVLGSDAYSENAKTVVGCALLSGVSLIPVLGWLILASTLFSGAGTGLLCLFDRGGGATNKAGPGGEI